MPLNDHFQWWAYVHGASWRHPLGPDSSIAGKEKYPVVHVAYDGRGGLREVGRQASADRSRMGVRRARRADGQALSRGATSSSRTANWMANIHQGISRSRHRRGRLRRHRAGRAVSAERLRTLRRGRQRVGVVSDWYRPDYYAQLAAAGGVARNPQGPARRSIPPSRA